MSHGTKGVSCDGCGHGSLAINAAILQPTSVLARGSCLARSVYFDGEGDKAGLIFPALMGEVQTPCVILGRSM